MRSMQLKLIQIKQGLLVIPLLNLYNNTIWISSLGSTELKWVHNRVGFGFDSLLGLMVRLHTIY